MAAVATAWLMHQKHVASVIIGPKNMEQLETYLSAASISLDQDELDILDLASLVISPLYPENFNPVGWIARKRKKQLMEKDNAG